MVLWDAAGIPLLASDALFAYSLAIGAIAIAMPEPHRRAQTTRQPFIRRSRVFQTGRPLPKVINESVEARKERCDCRRGTAVRKNRQGRHGHQRLARWYTSEPYTCWWGPGWLRQQRLWPRPGSASLYVKVEDVHKEHFRSTHHNGPSIPSAKSSMTLMHSQKFTCRAFQDLV